MNTLQLSWSAIVPTLLTAALLLSACGEEELGPPACDLELRDGSAAETWIRVEPGSFMMGANQDFQQWYYLDRQGSGAILEQMRATITRPYYAMATAVTNRTWDELMDGNRVSLTECAACPVEAVRRADVMMFANALSARDGFELCYDLTRCTGEPGNLTASCPADLMFDFECAGYRLPTAGEFEYFARAGTTTSYHCGELQERNRNQCLHDHEWTGTNWRILDRYPPAELEMQPTTTLCPNPWGFYDVGSARRGARLAPPVRHSTTATTRYSRMSRTVAPSSIRFSS